MSTAAHTTSITLAWSVLCHPAATFVTCHVEQADSDSCLNMNAHAQCMHWHTGACKHTCINACIHHATCMDAMCMDAWDACIAACLSAVCMHAVVLVHSIAKHYMLALLQKFTHANLPSCRARTRMCCPKRMRPVAPINNEVSHAVTLRWRAYTSHTVGFP